jgi:opacity protein-like surface antigen
LQFAQAQWHLDLFGGIANYSGDLQSKSFTTQQSNGGAGVALRYDLNGHFSLLSGLNYGKLGASDQFSQEADLRARNLSFETNIFEWNLMAEYDLFDISEKRFTPYAFAGFAIFHFNPYAYDTSGQKVYLRPLSTEGEGLPQYPDRKPYSLIQPAIPFGGGIKFRVTSNVTIAYEVSFRKLFTDYLDDVSTTYVDKNILLQERGPLAVEMAYRGNEIKGGDPDYPAAGSIRGDPKHKDWYYFSGIKVSVGLGKIRNTLNRKGVIDCPKKVT